MKRADLFTLALAALSFALPVAAQQYPARQITLIVPFTPGGQQDVEARALAQSMEPRLKQSVIVENRPGAGGAIGMGLVARAAPDGYTVLVTGASAALLHIVSANLGFDPTKDVAPVSMLIDGISLIAAPSETGAKNWNEFMAIVRKNPGKLNYASTGVGSIMLAIEGLKGAAGGLVINEVPYKGAQEYMAAVLRNDVQLVLNTVAGLKPQIDAGKLVPLLAVGDRRHPVYPEVPSTGDLGYGGGIRSFAWTGAFVPAGTPPSVIDTLYREVAVYTKDPATTARVQKSFNVMGGSTPAEFKKVYDADIAAWTAVAKAINLKPQ